MMFGGDLINPIPILYTPGCIPETGSLPVPGESDAPGQAVGDHVQDGELDVADDESLLLAPLLGVPEVSPPLQGPGSQH